MEQVWSTSVRRFPCYIVIMTVHRLPVRRFLSTWHLGWPRFIRSCPGLVLVFSLDPDFSLVPVRISSKLHHFCWDLWRTSFVHAIGGFNVVTALRELEFVVLVGPSVAHELHKLQEEPVSDFCIKPGKL